jgi:hypothetical protein
MKSNDHETIANYAAKLSDNHAAICRLLHAEMETALAKATSKIWHSMPVWFIGENPVVGYKSAAKHVNLLFWSGQLFGDSALKATGKFKAAQIQFTDASQIDTKALRQWLKKSSREIWDYQGHFRTHKASQKKTRE